MTTKQAAVTFPSLDFFRALGERMNREEAKYRAIGIMDLALGVRIKADGALHEDKLYLLTFDGYGCEGAEEPARGAALDPDFTIEGPYRAWKEMFQNIQRNGKADTHHTLNHLTMLDDPLEAVSPDQYRLDKLYRYNYSLQVFLEEAAALDTRYPG